MIRRFGLPTLRRLAPLAGVLVACAIPSAGAVAQRARAAEPWYPRAVCYEIFVRSFFDSDGDGVGDLRGLTAKLDYVRDLGADCIWLMPIAESPSYHGYDVVDYYRVDAEYGTAADFRRLMREAHRRGIHVIVDLVLNHTSSRHPFFQQALADPASPYRPWYRFAAAHPGVKNPWGGDNWHRSALRDEYFYGFFWSGMPDLDYSHPPVRAEANRIADFWLREMGVDGFRLDAVSFLVEEDHAHVQHTAGTHAVLRGFGGHVREAAPGSFTIGEVWDSTGTLRPYYPDQLDAYFAFEVSDSILAAVRRGAAAPLLQAVTRASRDLPPRRWAPFLRNHDQERTLTALGGDPARARLAATLLLTLPGVPFLYYGEEIGMPGPKDGQPEADMGVRTPMQWSAAPNAGFTRGTPWHPPRAGWETGNVAAQEADPASLLNHYRRLIRLRSGSPALATGDWVPLESSHPAAAAYLRRAGRRSVLVLVNLSGERLTDVTVSAPGVLAPGSYQPRSLLGGEVPRPLHVRPGRGVRAFAPLATLEPMTGYLMEL
jgi:alpha-amylase